MQSNYGKIHSIDYVAAGAESVNRETDSVYLYGFVERTGEILPRYILPAETWFAELQLRFPFGFFKHEFAREFGTELEAMKWAVYDGWLVQRSWKVGKGRRRRYFVNLEKLQEKRPIPRHDRLLMTYLASEGTESLDGAVLDSQRFLCSMADLRKRDFIGYSQVGGDYLDYLLSESQPTDPTD